MTILGLVIGCGGSNPSGEGEDTCCDGGWIPEPTSTSSTGGSTSSTTPGEGVDSTPWPECYDDSECPDGSVCVDESCVPSEGCMDSVLVPVCGNDVREGAEECDGEPGCDACISSIAPTFERTELDRWLEAVATGPAPPSVVGAGEVGDGAWVVALDSMGTDQWAVSPGDNNVIVRDVVVDETGQTHVVGASGPQDNRQWWAVALSPAGMELWTLTDVMYGEALAIDVDASGSGVVIAGSNNGSGVIYTYDAGGIQTGVTQVAGSSELRGIVPLGVDDYAVAGFDDETGSATIARLTDSMVQWEHALSFPGAGKEIFYDLERSSGGSLVAVGAADGGPWITTYDVDGSADLDQRCVGNLLGRILSVAPLGDTRFGIAGEWSLETGEPASPWAAVIFTDGSVTWSRSASLSEGATEATTRGVASEGDNLYVAGWRVTPQEPLTGWLGAYVP